MPSTDIAVSTKTSSLINKFNRNCDPSALVASLASPQRQQTEQETREIERIRKGKQKDVPLISLEMLQEQDLGDGNSDGRLATATPSTTDVDAESTCTSLSNNRIHGMQIPLLTESAWGNDLMLSLHIMFYADIDAEGLEQAQALSTIAGLVDELNSNEAQEACSTRQRTTKRRALTLLHSTHILKYLNNQHITHSIDKHCFQ